LAKKYQTSIVGMGLYRFFICLQKKNSLRKMIYENFNISRDNIICAEATQGTTTILIKAQMSTMSAGKF
jgi:hypothetical protein